MGLDRAERQVDMKSGFPVRQPTKEREADELTLDRRQARERLVERVTAPRGRQQCLGVVIVVGRTGERFRVGVGLGLVAAS